MTVKVLRRLHVKHARRGVGTLTGEATKPGEFAQILVHSIELDSGEKLSFQGMDNGYNYPFHITTQRHVGWNGNKPVYTNVFPPGPVRLRGLFFNYSWSENGKFVGCLFEGYPPSRPPGEGTLSRCQTV